MNFERNIVEKGGEGADMETQGGRYEVIIHQSFKNTVPLLHKEFLRVPNFECACPVLRPGKMYLIMGMTQSSGKGREVWLAIDSSSYTRRFSARVKERILKIRNNEMKYCNKWRNSSPRNNVVKSEHNDQNMTDILDDKKTLLLPSYLELGNNVIGYERPEAFVYNTNTSPSVEETTPQPKSNIEFENNRISQNDFAWNTFPYKFLSNSTYFKRREMYDIYPSLI